MHEFKALKLVKQHPVIKRFLLITAGIFFVFVLLLLLPWQQNIEGTGVLTALDPQQRDFKITAPVDGFLDEVYVKENQFVEKGTKLFKMKDLDAQYQNRLLSIKEKSELNHKNELEKIERLKENLVKEQDVLNITKDIYNKKIQQINNTIEALENQKIALANTLRIDKIHYTRSKSLHKEGIESKRDLELTESTFLHTTAQLQQIVTKIENMHQDLHITREEKTRFIEETNIKINQLKNNIVSSQNMANSLKQNIKRDSIALSRYLSSDVVSRSDGYILRVYQNNQNRLIKRGEDILFFSPAVTKRAIRVKLSDFNMPLIKKGLKVRIIFYGWPALQISGWPKIAHGTYGGIINSIERVSHEKGAYYAIITEDANDDPWPARGMLKVGTQASVWVTLGIVPLWYEIWRRMMALPSAMVESSQ
ncbi:MAG TPA: biotin/lipoyl-binding protein [Sulfurovum sp.]|nr:biotin/lipoyl-binding protein [Sulfurovum sp.]